MPGVELAHTSQLDRASRSAARALLYDVFAPEITQEDWEHSLGGMHALIRERGELIGHAALVQRQLIHDGRAVRTGYVEGVAVRADRRREGHGRRLMEALEPLIRSAYDLGALGATEDGAPFYAAIGWTRWQGPTQALTPQGVVRTEDEDGWIYVLQPTPPLDPTKPLTADEPDILTEAPPSHARPLTRAPQPHRQATPAGTAVRKTPQLAHHLRSRP